MTTNPKTRISLAIIAATALIALLCIFYSRAGFKNSRQRMQVVTKTLSPGPIMSTPQFNIIAVCDDDKVDAALAQAETAARIVEREMNIYNPASELSKFNAAPAGECGALSPETDKALRLAKQAYDETGGAFDATLRPVILLWKNGIKTNTIPTAAELAAARKSSSWADMDFSENCIKKTKASACIDLGGIAKGYANDLGVEALKKAGCSGGLVDIGGGIACFGCKADGSKWTIAVRDPFELHSGKMLVTLRAGDAGVCTSGNYERSGVIQGKKYNHIINPKTLMPTDTCASATVIAPTAAQADAWATALCVLGPDGLKLLPKNGTIQALLVIGNKDNFKIVLSPDFSKYVVQWGVPMESVEK